MSTRCVAYDQSAFEYPKRVPDFKFGPADVRELWRDHKLFLVPVGVASVSLVTVTVTLLLRCETSPPRRSSRQYPDGVAGATALFAGMLGLPKRHSLKWMDTFLSVLASSTGLH